MKKIRLLSLFLAVTMLFCMVSCRAENGEVTGSGQKGTVNLKLWGSQDDQALLGELIEKFKAENTDKNYNITLAVVGESDAKTKILEDPDAAADVFSFSNDQLRDLVNAGALYEITRNVEVIKNNNLAGSVDAATLNDKLYGYPMTADNGYFLYYDKSVVSDNDAKSLDSILAAANKAGKKVYMDVSNGWYIASFFLGAGCTLDIGENGKQICDFDSETGIAVGEAIKAFTADPAFVTGDDAVLTGGIGSSICAGVSGTWNAEAVMSKLGDNYAATKLPTFTVSGKQVQMSSFAGFKLMGISKNTSHPVEAMKLAEFLTNESSQRLRFEKRALGPSNIKVSESDAVKANLALAALSEQAEYAKSQKNVTGSFWTPAEAFGLEMESKNYSKSIAEQLKNMVSQITA